MISYRIGFSECEHRRASNGQHARKRLFNDSFPACQGLISGIFLGPRRVLFFCRDSGGPRYWPAAVAGAGFLAAHPLLHLVMIASGHDHDAAFELIAIVLPSALALFSAFPDPGERDA